MLYDVNIEKDKIFIINELLVNETGIVLDYTFGFLNTTQKGLHNTSVNEQCTFLKKRLDIIKNMLNIYKSDISKNNFEEINETRNIFLQKNFKSDTYANCVSNFWFGINTEEPLNTDVNMVQGHLWQYLVMIFGGKKIADEKNVPNVPINDKRITKIINTTDTFIEYGITDGIAKKASRDSYSGMTSNCSTESTYPRTYRLDVAVSRAFNDNVLNNEKIKKHEITLENQYFRFPQALHIVYTGDDYKVYFRRTHENIMRIHMNNLTEPNIKEDDVLLYKQKYIKYIRKIHDLKYGLGKYSIYKH